MDLDLTIGIPDNYNAILRDINVYGDNNQDALITFRVYLDKIAMVGPYIFDIIWDRVILFTKKKKT